MDDIINHMIKDNFKTASGHSWLSGKKVDVDEIKKFFLSKKVDVKEINETGRFLNIIGNLNTQKVFIKVSTSEGLNEKLLNEISWHDELKRVGIDLNITPLLENGYIDNTLVYAIYEFVEGYTLDSMIEKIDSKILKDLVNINISIDCVKGINLFKNQQEREHAEKAITSIKDKATHYFKVAENFAKESGEDLTELLDVVKNYEKMDEMGLNHNDFTPRNILYSDGKLILTDGESASTTSPRFYDVAIMYTRLYLTYSRPDLAKEYLNEFIKLLPENYLDTFNFAFKTMLASRTIGGFWEATTGGADLEYCKRLMEEILSM